MFHTLENGQIRIVVSTLGATLVSLIEKATGIDAVLGFDNEDNYIKYINYMGTTVARCANRIEKGHFILNDKEYNVTINDGENSLHGGKGVSYKEFEVKEKTDNYIVLYRKLLDKEDGYPGNMDLNVKYEILNDILRITISGLSDQDTLFSPTIHTYFNLSGSNVTCENNLLKIYTNTVALNDESGLSIEKTIDVKDTGFDFSEFTSIKDNLDKKHPNFSLGGIDHNYVFEEMGLKKMCTLKGDKIELSVFSDLPDMHVYTANYFTGEPGKYGMKYVKHMGVAIEPQFYPNSINYKNLLKPIIKANEKVSHVIEYKLNIRN